MRITPSRAESTTRPMTRREALRALAAGAGAGACYALGLPGTAAAAEPATAAGARPNILFILADDLGWSDVGFNDGPIIETPNLDRLAQRGMRFTSAYAPAANCAPSRASMLTGQYTVRHGIYQFRERREHPLSSVPNRRTLQTGKFTMAEGLAAAGYHCAFIGKWHLGHAGGDTGPLGQGFHLNIGGDHNGSPRSGYFPPYRYPVLEQQGDGVERSEMQEPKGGRYLTDRFTDEAIEYVRGRGDQPFFLYLSYHNPHTPLQGPPALLPKYRRKTEGRAKPTADYAAMVENLDGNVGRLLAALEQEGKLENTLVVFFSDNGGLNRATSNDPLRGAKRDFYEGGIREPMLAAWPGRIAPGSRCDVPVHGVDLLPTFLALAGGQAPADHPLDGESLLPLFEGRDALADRPLFWHFPGYIKGAPPVGVVRQGDYKLMEFFEDGRLELYNLREDIGEQDNLAARQPDRTARLHALMRNWRQRVNAPMPQPNPDYQP